MHLNKVMHRDIKPENIMFKKLNDLNSLKIIDFGLAMSFNNDSRKIKKFCGTIKFMAPEILENKSYEQNVDIWACGIILYMLLSGGSHPVSEHFSVNGISQYKSILCGKTNSEYEWKFNDGFPL